MWMKKDVKEQKRELIIIFTAWILKMGCSCNKFEFTLRITVLDVWNENNNFFLMSRCESLVLSRVLKT